MDSDIFSAEKSAAANRAFAKLSTLRDTYETASKSSYSRVWKECQDIYYLPATLRGIVKSSTKIFDLAMEELEEYVVKKEFLTAGALFGKLPWWNIWPQGVGIESVLEETKTRAAKFKETLVNQSLEVSGPTETEKLIRILSFCEKPGSSRESLIVNDAIETIVDPNEAFELAAYWNTSPYFVLWDSKQNVAKIYQSRSDGLPVVSIYQVLELFLKVSR